MRSIPSSHTVSTRYHPYQRPHTDAGSAYQGRYESSYQDHQAQTHATSSRYTSNSRQADRQQNQRSRGSARDHSPLTDERIHRQYRSGSSSRTDEHRGQDYGRYDSQYGREYSESDRGMIDRYQSRDNESHSRGASCKEGDYAERQYTSSRREHWIPATDQSTDHYTKNQHHGRYTAQDQLNHTAYQEQPWCE